MVLISKPKRALPFGIIDIHIRFIYWTKVLVITKTPQYNILELESGRRFVIAEICEFTEHFVNTEFRFVYTTHLNDNK